jgi:hypothetical protein
MERLRSSHPQERAHFRDQSRAQPIALKRFFTPRINGI